jgi:pimeloyl-ACP methyl ester carboxylesterase
MLAYFISGLGADERVYENIKLPDEYSIKHIRWLEPESNESFSSYCLRLSLQIDKSIPFVLIGMSLGGLVAIELNKYLKPEKTIIISTVISNRQFSIVFKLIKLFQLHKITPAFLLKIPSPIAYWFFGIHSKDEKLLLKSFMKNVTDTYLKWSIDKVINWENTEKPSRLFHIHGTADKIFPHKKLNPDITILNGGHLMVHNKSEELNKALATILKN